MNLESYVERYSERIAILIENGYFERIAEAKAREEIINRARAKGADIKKLLEILTEK